MEKKMVTQHRVPYRISPRRNLLRHRVVRWTKKLKTENIKSNKGKSNK